MLFAIWLMVGSFFGLACGLLAIRRNRTAVGYFLFGLATGPIALAAVLIQKHREEPAFL